MDRQRWIRGAMLAAIPHLRAFAISLCRNGDRADDLVQETLARAFANMAKFETGSNVLPWLITILRNEYYSDWRKRFREVEDVDGKHADTLVSNPDQVAAAEHQDLQRALSRLPVQMREALLLVAGSGLSYDEAARACGCAIGTIRSRVHRARGRLAEMLFVDGQPEFTAGAIERSWLASQAASFGW